MTDKPAVEPKTMRNLTTTIAYEKPFAFLGVVCGLALFLGSPWFLLVFWNCLPGRLLQSWPAWGLPVMASIGMGGGMLTLMVSIFVGILMPSRVTRETTSEVNDDPTPEN